MQLSISFDIHKRENNPVSQAFLDKHMDEFAMDAWKLLIRLLEGERFTNRKVQELNISNSPTRRWSDIREWGVNISSTEVEVPYSSRKVLEYWLEPDEINRVCLLIAKGLIINKNKAA